MPSPPPLLIGNWHVTHKVWQIYVFPVLNSPNISVIDPVSMPPPNNWSRDYEPVDNLINDYLFSKNVDAVWNPKLMIFWQASIILSTFASERPLTIIKCFFGVNATASTVWNPASSSFFMSPALIPFSSKALIGVGPSISSSSAAAYSSPVSSSGFSAYFIYLFYLQKFKVFLFKII